METHTVRGGGGIELAVREAGAGQPVLLVHGLSQSAACWREQFDSGLTDEFRLVAMDCRGHGESEKPRETGAYGDSALWAADVRAVMDTLDLDDVVLVGWSYGGLVVLDYLERHGTDRVAGLALVGAVSGIGTEAATDVLGEDYLALLSGFGSTDAEESVAALRAFVDLCTYDDLSPSDRYFVLGYNVVVPPHVRDGLRDRTVTHDDELESLDVPALLVHGADDAVVLPEASRRHADRLDDAERVTYPETGHSPFLEAPERFNDDLRAFVARTQ